MSNALQHLLGTAVIVVVITAALQLSGCVYNSMNKMDANDRCVEQHTWNTTTVSGPGPLICPGWYLERRAKDGAQ